MIVVTDPFYFAQQARIVAAMDLHRIPAVYGFRNFVDAGGLMSYGVNLPAQWNRAAHYVDRVVKGAKPADLPVEQPTKFELVVNLKTARSLGLVLPPVVLLRADHVIE